MCLWVLRTTGREPVNEAKIKTTRLTHTHTFAAFFPETYVRNLSPPLLDDSHPFLNSMSAVVLTFTFLVRAARCLASGHVGSGLALSLLLVFFFRLMWCISPFVVHAPDFFFWHVVTRSSVFPLSPLTTCHINPSSTPFLFRSSVCSSTTATGGSA